MKIEFWFKLYSVLSTYQLSNFQETSNKSITKLPLCSENILKHSIFLVNSHVFLVPEKLVQNIRREVWKCIKVNHPIGKYCFLKFW